MRTPFTLFFLFLALTSWAQPGNDDCSGIIDLGLAPICSDTAIYNNFGATPTDIGNDNVPACWVGTPERDVWFSFVSSDTILDYMISVIGCPDPILGTSAIVNPEIAIYRGDVCDFDELFLLACASSSADPGTNNVVLTPPALTPGIRYFLRVNDWSSTAVGNDGAFKICIEPEKPIVNIDGGGSDACAGEIYDTGGAGGDYGNNENHVFTICPKDEHSCLKFDLEFYDLENAIDPLIFFDGPDVNSPQIEIYGANNPFNLNGVTAGGGVCASLTATSGCLTIQFTSDAANVASGFHGFWECLQEPCDTPVAITADGNSDDQTIIDNIATSQMTVTIDTIICGENQYGVFSGDDSNLGMEKGLLLTSGNIVNAIGPNGGFNLNENAGAPGDADLDSLSVNNPSFDACIVEVDVFVPTDELTFEYIFGSEEYAEYINQNFNDIFAFLVSGPGIVGLPSLNGQENIALIPGTDIPVEINSINHTMNWEYYRSNELDVSNPFSPGGKSIGYDGMTTDFLGAKKTLTARKKVTPCETYHLKLAIADRGDNVFDSGVFISEIQGGTPTLATKYFSGIDYLVEECTVVPDEVIISIPLPETEVTFYEIVIGGTATLGDDYTLNIPDTVTFQPGETQFKFPIKPLIDGVPEGLETIEISLTRDFGCGQFIYSTLVIELRDELFVEILAGQDTAFVCEGGGAVQLNASGANQYAWTPSAIFDDNKISDPLATPLTSGFVRVDGTLGVCFDRDSVWLEIIDPQLDIAVLGDTTFCVGGSVPFNAINNVNNTNLVWTPNINISDDQAPLVTANPETDVTYVATVSLLGCSASDTVRVEVDPFDFPTLMPDATICQNSSIQLANNIPVTTTNYVWTPDFFLSPNNTVSGPTATPDISTIYTLNAESARAYCSQSGSVAIEVLPANIEITEGDSLFICLGENIVINSESTTDGVGQTWRPHPSIMLLDNETIEVTPTVTTTYLSTLVVGTCTVYDSIVVVVDSLPNLDLFTVPNQEEFCIGDTITILSTPYENSDFPFIEFDWTPTTGNITSASNPILVTTVFDNANYTRTVTNRACSGSSDLEIKAAEDFNLLDMAAQNSCPGDEVVLTAGADAPNVTYTWAVQGGASLGGVNPITVSPDVTTTYEVSAVDENNCFTQVKTTTVSIYDPTLISDFQVLDKDGNVFPVLEVFENDLIFAQVITAPGLSNATYSWFLDGTSLGPPTTEPKIGTFAVPSVDGEGTEMELEVQITDDNGCAAIATISVLILPNKNIAFPNLFTPDGDNNNDFFNYVGGSESNPPIIKEFKIYNRWGQLVYDNENTSQGWDGMVDGSPAPVDVYIYRIIYQKSDTDPEETVSGEVSILR